MLAVLSSTAVAITVTRSSTQETGTASARVLDHVDLPAAPMQEPPEAENGELRNANWPSGARGTVLAADKPRKVGKTPVTVAKKSGKPQVVAATVIDQEQSRKAGVSGVVIEVRPTEDRQSKDDDKLSVGVDYSEFDKAIGGAFGSRLGLARMPACALTTPERPECRTQERIPSRNDHGNRTVTADVAAEPMVLAAVADQSGPQGTFKASSLGPSGNWSVSPGTGSFSWSYPIDVPAPASGKVAPSVSLSYSSSSVDGRTSASNGQASWIGQGWDYTPGFIERSYKSCSEDKTLPQAQQIADYCWQGQVVTMNLGGQSNQLVRDDNSGVWRTAGDHGATVELVQGANNGLAEGEHWKVTTTDGVSYYFGRNTGPGHNGQEETKSAWGVPVYYPKDGDTCYRSNFADSWCKRGWRWMLDFVEDPHGNVTSYYYTPETNFYGANGKGVGVEYTRGGVLSRIDYGLRKINGSIYTAPAPNQIVFTPASRCVPADGYNCDLSQLDDSKAKYWPDLPEDQICKPGATCENHSPSYFSTQRLAKITTQYTVDGATKPVDVFELGLTYPELADKELRLDSIKRTAHHPDGSAVSPPVITFESQPLANRVEGYNSTGAYPHWRLTKINTDTGAKVNVTYSDPDCTSSSHPTNFAQNDRLCYPVYWTLPLNTDPVLDLFHKYVVRKVIVEDGNKVGDDPPRSVSPQQITTYRYLGTPAWHLEDNELAKPERRTYGQFRGYGQTEVLKGDGDGPERETLTRSTFYRGMGGSVTDSRGQSVVDNNLFAGTVREEEIFEGDGGRRLTSKISTQTVIGGPTASRGRTSTGLEPLTANVVEVAEATSIIHLAAGGEQKATTVNRHDALGRVVAKTDMGDGVPDLCTTTKYADVPARGIRDRMYEVIQSQQACPAEGVAQTSVTKQVRTYFDGSAELGALSGAGDPTSTAEAVRASDGSLTFQPNGTITYDPSGRPIKLVDALNRTTLTAYTPLDGGIVSKIVTTNAKNQTTTTEFEPSRGQTVKSVDVGNRVSEATYDALGRVTAVWNPGQARTSDPNVKYEYLLRTDGPLAVTTKTLIDYNTGTNYVTSVSLLDAFGQSRQTQSEAIDDGSASRRVVSETFYDSHGWAVSTNNSYLVAGAPGTTLVDVAETSVDNRTENEFDGSGRTVKTTSYRGLTPVEESRTVYGGDRTTSFPPTGGVINEQISNVRGQVLETRQYTKPPVVNGSVVSGGEFQATARHYSGAGLLDLIKDNAGNQWTFTHDLRGRTTSQTDPDAGTTSTTYDQGGLVESTKNADGKSLFYEYDVLGRRTVERADSKTGTMLAQWRYDGATNGVGLPHYSTRYTPTGNYDSGPSAYDGAGNVTDVILRVPASEQGFAGTYTTSTSYTRTGLPKTLTLPAKGGLPGVPITTTYNKYGLPQKTEGYNVYVSSSSYGPFGEPLKYVLGANTAASDLTFSYDAHTRRLVQSKLSGGQAPPLIDETNYSYDHAGNLLKQVNNQGTAGTRTQCFTYDALQRLTQARTSTDSCTAEPAQTNLGSLAPYWQSWTFDPTGLRKTQVNHATVAGQQDKTTAYNYPAAGAARPHSLTSTSDNTSYTYDASGNTKTKTLPSGQQTFDWDYSNRLKSVTTQEGATSYAYDADGNQLIRRDPDKSTLFLPMQELVRNNQSGNVTGTRYYLHGGTKVGMRVGGGNFKFELSDLHNTGQVVVDSVSREVTRRAMDPYGNAIGGNVAGPWPNGRGFLDRPVSTVTGLTDIGARKYDAVTGRFISVDPLLDLTAPQTWTGYTYANNNPTTFADPSGLFCDGCEYSDNQIGNHHGVGCSYDPTGSCRSQEEVDLGYQIETGQNEDPALQPTLFGVPVPTYSVIKAIRPAGHGYGPGDTYTQAVHDWASARCVRPGEADRDFCAGANASGMLDPKNPMLHKIIGAVVVGGMAALACIVACVPVLTAAAAFSPEAAVMTSAIMSAEAIGGSAALAGVGATAVLAEGASLGALPGTAGVQIAGRLNPGQMAALSAEHGVEFALIYRHGPKEGGRGGTYHLYSGQARSVTVPVGPDVQWIYHTHPGGTPYASYADVGALQSLKAAGSPQRSSQVILPSGGTIRFGGKWSRQGEYKPLSGLWS
ncbi:type IV secretion protein Rhs [Lentzea sp. NBC_00516]|uniref:RHS repeat domain-containing protein n=1 Tax=Lentzea sp. NBC_00516 TaxID=2903582 RepID=UPI002E816ACC|nr:RHS repeat-associated core domain-containing protein [Lentzea sp. NBC_00516]WUD23871.1 type IV secretion protein Rhs [Lentzea sp. NBC_00516]